MAARILGRVEKEERGETSGGLAPESAGRWRERANLSPRRANLSPRGRDGGETISRADRNSTGAEIAHPPKKRFDRFRGRRGAPVSTPESDASVREWSLFDDNQASETRGASHQFSGAE